MVLHDEGRLPGDAVLEPDLLTGGVQGAVARAGDLELREARGAVGIQLQPRPASSGSVLQHRSHHAASGSSGD